MMSLGGDARKGFNSLALLVTRVLFVRASLVTLFYKKIKCIFSTVNIIEKHIFLRLKEISKATNT